MRLSEVPDDRAFDIVPELMDAVLPLTKDPEVLALFQRNRPDGMTVAEYQITWVRKATMKVLKPHKKDFIRICSLIEGISEDEYRKNLTFEKLMEDVIGLYADDLFYDIFFYPLPNGDPSVVSASENTAVPED